MSKLVKLNVLVILLILTILSSSVLAYDVDLWINGKSCGEKTAPCIVSEADVVLIEANAPEGCSNIWTEVGGDRAALLRPQDGSDLIDGVWYKSEWLMPRVSEDSLIKINYIRDEDCGNLLPSTGWILVKDVVPQKQQCYTIGTGLCNDINVVGSIAAKGDLYGRNLVYVTNVLDIFNINGNPRLVFGQLNNPLALFNSSSANFSTLPVEMESVTLSGSMIVGSAISSEGSTVVVNANLVVEDELSDSNDATLNFETSIENFAGMNVYDTADLGSLLLLQNLLTPITISALNINQDLIVESGSSITLNGVTRWGWADASSFSVDNLMSNSGFEMQTVSGWSSSGSNSISTSTNSYNGLYAARVDVSGTGSVTSPSVLVNDENTYSVSVMVKNSVNNLFALNDYPVLSVVCQGNSGLIEPEVLSQNLVDGNEWQKTSVVFNAVQGTNSCVLQFSIDDDFSSGFYIIDNVQFEQAVGVSGYKPGTLDYLSNVEYNNIDARNIETNGVTAYNAYFGPFDVNDVGLIGEKNLIATEFEGPVNLNGCDTVSNKLRNDDGFSLIFGDSTGKCGAGDFCQDDSDCATGICGSQNKCVDCANGLDDDGDGDVDMCDSDCSCPEGSTFFGCSTCATCTSSATNIEIDSSVSFNLNIVYGLDPDSCTFDEGDGTLTGICGNQNVLYDSVGNYNPKFINSDTSEVACPSVSVTCTPETCESLGATCGEHSDGCGNTIVCGTDPNVINAITGLAVGEGAGANAGECTTGTCIGGNCVVEDCTNGIDDDEDGLTDYEDVLDCCTDADSDGIYAEPGCNFNFDCNDNNPQIYPGQTEVCNDGVDNDCDGLIDYNDVGDCCTDSEPDGYYVEDACPGLPDCNDVNSGINPGQIDYCNGIDDDCSAVTVDGSGEDYFFPTENLCDGNDNDCDGLYDTDDPDLVIPDADKTAGVCAGQQKTCGGVNGWQEPDYSSIPNYQADEDICDEIDNDCDGIVDEGCGTDCLAGQSRICGINTGACNQGTEYCVSGSWSGVCTDGYVGPSSEVCDGLDNDCDSSVDEGVLNTYYIDFDDDTYGDPDLTTQACSLPNADYVTNGDDCNDIAPAINPAATEICDGRDNDCDGFVDEGCDNDDDNYCDAGITYVSAGYSCNELSNNDCCNNGGNDCNDVVNSINPGAAEICGNGIDDNCNGIIDTDCCTASETNCGDGLDNDCDGDIDVFDTDCCTPTGAEVCDNIDNDCDGSIDESLTQACGTNTGVCNQGTQSCSAGTWGACGGAYVGPSENPEVSCSNGLDDDCDGSTDLLDSDCCMPTNGGVETCDNIDNDCDGSVDEGLTQVCGTNNGVCSQGTQSCSAGSWSACGGPSYVGPTENPETSCDTLDNDCDGETDEGCSCVPSNGGVEICDGIDNDCDGSIDNGLIAPNANNQNGVCSGAKQVCSGVGGWVEPNYAGLAYYEASEVSCDGRDNNCDGSVDNGLTAPAADQATGVCDGWLKWCDGVNGWQEPDYTTAPGWANPENPSNCDTLDNNCDGFVDEGCVCPDGQTQQCGTTSKGPCQFGSQTCSNGAWGDCTGNIEPSAETCDGVDNNCDEITDNGLTAPNANDQDGVCNGAKKVCSGASGWQEPNYNNIAYYEATESSCSDTRDNDCDTNTDAQDSDCCVVSNGGVEICDGLDNDCDGSVDENDGAGSETSICCVGQDQDGDGYYGRSGCGTAVDCNDNAAAVYPGATEICDGLENNCDTIGNGADYIFTCVKGSTQSCGTNEGECNVGEKVCSNSCTWPANCGGSYIGPTSESCDGKDNDCDTFTDEGCDNDDDNYCDDSMTYVSAGYSCNEAANNDCCNNGGGDCRDGNSAVNPGANEGNLYAGTCTDGIDNDCDGLADTADDSCSCDDSDNDGFYAQDGCGTAVDCNDNAADVYPGATEICDGLENNCDTIGNGADYTFDCVQGSSQTCGTNTGVCNQGTQTCSDSCTLGACGGTYVGSSSEVCDGLDNDCDGIVDEDGTGAANALQTTYYQDSDGDGYGNPGVSESACSAPDGYVENVLDCNDGNSQIYSGQTENCNDGVDNDCDWDGNSFLQLADYDDSDCSCPDGYVQDSLDACVGDNDPILGALLDQNYEVSANIIGAFSGDCASCDAGSQTLNSCSGCTLSFKTSSVQDDTVTVTVISQSSNTELSFGCLDNDGDQVFGQVGCGDDPVDCDDNDIRRTPGKTELCNNNIDDNCDGVVNEGCCEPLTSNDVTCDSVDDDCDGSLSEDYASSPVAADKTAGVCAGQIKSCNNNVLTEPNYNSIAYYESDETSCDGLDNDCDGTVDEGCCDPTQGGCTGGSFDICDRQIKQGNCDAISGCAWYDGADKEYEWQQCYESCTASDCYPIAFELSPPAITACQQGCWDSCEPEDPCVTWNGATAPCCYGSAVESCSSMTWQSGCESNGCTWTSSDPDCIGTDADGDNYYLQAGFGAGVDCDDGNNLINPGKDEICGNSVDENCDGFVESSCCTDSDSDGFYVQCGKWLDCDDGDSSVKPSAQETCNNQDDDCDDVIDNNIPTQQFNNWQGVCNGWWAYCESGSIGMHDTIVPNYESTESTFDCLDNDCDGSVDEGTTAPLANKQDGVCSGARKYCSGTTLTDANYASYSTDYESTETTCDSKDNDCDGDVDEGLTTQKCFDDDGDGYGDPSLPANFCNFDAAANPRYKDCNDCNDASSSINPGVAEQCDGIDNDCDGTVDEGCDDDNDGYCDDSMTYVSGCTLGGGDCSDNDNAIHPTATEFCDGIDNDCDADTVDGADEKTIPNALLQNGVCAGTKQVCAGDGEFVEPDYTTISGYQATESTCDNLDNDCDGIVDEDSNGVALGLQTTYYWDEDQDGYGDVNYPYTGCTTSTKFNTVIVGDCNHNDADVYPGATEASSGPGGSCALCSDNKDNDCDGNTDMADSSCLSKDCPLF